MDSPGLAGRDTIATTTAEVFLGTPAETKTSRIISQANDCTFGSLAGGEVLRTEGAEMVWPYSTDGFAVDHQRAHDAEDRAYAIADELNARRSARTEKAVVASEDEADRPAKNDAY